MFDAKGTFAVGDRVECHPGTDSWMRGDRFGSVSKVGRHYVYVTMERSNRTRLFTPDRLKLVVV